MNNIANLNGSPLNEALNNGLGHSLLVTANPTNTSNSREIKYIDPSNMKLGTSENNIQFGGDISDDEYSSNRVHLGQHNDDDFCIISTSLLGIHASDISIDNSSTDSVSLGKGEVTVKKLKLDAFTSCPETLHNDLTETGAVENSIGIAGIIFICLQYSGTVLTRFPQGTQVLVNNGSYTANIYPNSYNLSGVFPAGITTDNLTVKVDSSITPLQNGVYYLLNATSSNTNYFYAWAIRTE